MPENVIKQEKEDDDVEEILVYVEIDPTSMSENQIRDSARLKIVGNDKKVLLQVNKRFFEGQFDYSMGTHTFFAKDEKAQTDPLYNQCPASYKCVTKTNKFLKMSRVVVREQQTVAGKDDQRAEHDQKSSEIKLTRTYEEALNLFLPPGKSAPRKIPSDEDISQDLIEASEEPEAT